MNEKYGPLYAEAVIPKTTYTGMDSDNHNITVWNILAVNQSMGDDLAYQLTKLVLEKREDLARVHAEGRNIRPDLQSLKRSGIPFHPGALKYFAEKNIKVE
jgi:TRAP transporter TAXI family solute receptor